MSWFPTIMMPLAERKSSARILALSHAMIYELGTALLNLSHDESIYCLLTVCKSLTFLEVMYSIPLATW